MLAIDDQSVLTPRFSRYFRWAAWADVAVFAACLYLLYCWYQTLTGRATALDHPSLRFLLGIIGAVGVLAGTLLSKAMWAYWRQCDNRSRTSKKIWFSIMSFIPLFGPAAYYFLVYRKQPGEST